MAGSIAKVLSWYGRGGDPEHAGANGSGWPRRGAMLGVISLVAGGCVAGDDPSYLPAVRDSAGVFVVDNPAETRSDLDWRVDASPRLELGRADGEGPELFGSIRHVIRLRTGEIAVADAIAREVRVFGDDGRHVRTFGRHGEGPGEFSNLWRIGELPGDSIAVVDNLNGRVSVFGRAGEFARSFRLPRIPGASAPNVVGWLRDGTLVASTLTVSPSRDTRSRSTVLVYTVDREGRIAGQLGEYLHRQLGRNGLSLGFGGSAVLAAGDSLIWYGNSARFELRALDRDGSVRRLVRMDRTPRAVTEAEIAEARAVVRRSLARQRATGPVAQRILETEFADTHPVHGRLLVDGVGYLWVAHRQSRLLGADHPEQRSEEWDVFDSEGRLRGHLVLPRGFRVTQIGADFLLGVHTDAAGVQRVRLYRLERILG